MNLLLRSVKQPFLFLGLTNIQLLYCCSKKRKSVLLSSTLRHDNDVDRHDNDIENGKPDIIFFLE